MLELRTVSKQEVFFDQKVLSAKKFQKNSIIKQCDILYSANEHREFR